jgi:hypothetical protein
MDELKKQLNELLICKESCNNSIFILEKQIKNIQQKIYKTCENEEGGHQWVMEVEKGVYGETYYYCKKCNLFE